MAPLIESLPTKALGSVSALQEVEAERSEVHLKLYFVFEDGLGYRKHTDAHTHSRGRGVIKHKLHFAPRIL